MATMYTTQLGGSPKLKLGAQLTMKIGVKSFYPIFSFCCHGFNPGSILTKQVYTAAHLFPEF